MQQHHCRFFSQGDPQVGMENASQEKRKLPHVAEMCELIEQGLTGPGPSVDAVLYCGDLTTHGFSDDPVGTGCACYPKGATDELGGFRKRHYEPLKAKTKVLLVPGNHDRYSSKQRAREWIKKEMGGGHHEKIINGIRFVGLDECPSSSTLKWLKALPVDGRPMIVYLHMCLLGYHSNAEWWESKDATPPGDEKKNMLWDILAQFNVLGIFHGHAHGSYSYEWRGHPVFCCAGDFYADAAITRVAEDSENPWRLTVRWRNKDIVHPNEVFFQEF